MSSERTELFAARACRLADYQDDPTQDDFPSSMSSFTGGFATRGKSYFVGMSALSSLTLTNLEICSVVKPLCYASCISVTPRAGASSSGVARPT